MISRKFTKVASSLLLMLLLQGCLNDSAEQKGTKSAYIKNKATAIELIPEDADFSDRKAFFSTLSIHYLCKLAIEIEGNIAADPSDDSRFELTWERTPFRIVGDRVEVGGFYRNDTTNNGIAMRELSSRHSKLEHQADAEKERQKQKAEMEREQRQRVLAEQEKERLRNLTMEQQIEYKRKKYENSKTFYSSSFSTMTNSNVSSVSPDQLCGGTFEGKTFSVALMDKVVRRRALEKQNEARRKRTWESATRAPSIICKSSEFFGTVTTSCY